MVNNSLKVSLKTTLFSELYYNDSNDDNNDDYDHSDNDRDDGNDGNHDIDNDKTDQKIITFQKTFLGKA